ncbi:MAG: hypothetical protein JNK53_07095, partial [Phycisphaerae bacterium]|nr:hypothetical protein [Phycisphaerae bacterium]
LAGGAASVTAMLILTPQFGAWGPVAGYVAFAAAQTAAGVWLSLRLPEVRSVFAAAFARGSNYA